MKTQQTDPSQATLGNASPLCPSDDRPPLPEGWVWTTIGEMIGINGVFRDGDWVESKDQDPEGDVRLIQLADIGDGIFRDRSNRFLTSQKAVDLGCTFLETGDLLIARMPDPLGRACLFPGDPKRCVTVVDVCIVRSGQSTFDHRWLMYFVNSPQSRTAIASYQSGSTRKRISRSNLARIEYPVPPLPEQHRIVAAIETQFTRLDAAVAALERAKANLARYKASVLKAACEGRLVPTEAALYHDRCDYRGEETPQASTIAQMRGNACRGEATPQASTNAKMRGDAETPDQEEPGGGCLAPTDMDAVDAAYEPADVLLHRILAERRARWMVDNPGKRYVEPAAPDTSRLPDLPEGWGWASVEQVCQRIVDCLHSTPEFQDNGFMCVDTNSIKPGQIMLEKIRYVDQATFSERNRRMKPAEGDVLFSREGALLGIAVRVPPNIEFCLGQRMMVFRFGGLVNSKYYEIVLNSLTFRSQYLALITGTASPHLNIRDIRLLAIPLPPLAEQHRIVAEVERRLSVVAEVEASIDANLARTARLRQAILREAFAGRLVPRGYGDVGMDA